MDDQENKVDPGIIAVGAAVIGGALGFITMGWLTRKAYQRELDRGVEISKELNRIADGIVVMANDPLTTPDAFMDKVMKDAEILDLVMRATEQ